MFIKHILDVIANEESLRLLDNAVSHFWQCVIKYRVLVNSSQLTGSLYWKSKDCRAIDKHELHLS